MKQNKDNAVRNLKRHDDCLKFLIETSGIYVYE